MQRADPGTRHLDATQVIVRRQVSAIRRAWRGLDFADVRASFAARVAPAFIAAVTVGQLGAAALAASYVAESLGEPAEAPPVVPAAFAGVGAAGVPLEVLAQLLMIRTLADLGAGMSTTDAAARGLNRALLYGATEITDAGRAATHVQLIAERRAAGYERVVKVPACDRCIILTGRLYRYSQGFRRHPRCDCTMRPVTSEEYQESSVDNTPRALFDAMTRQQQDRRFGTAQAEAIRTGADMSQVVNARKGMTTASMFGRDLQITKSGTSVRATFGGYEIREDGTLRRRRDAELRKTPGSRYRSARTPRLTAGQIVRLGEEFRWDRAELVRQLRRYGYLF